ncbi:NACHT domain-containing protein [Xanthomonas tesorieronis]|uniref:NACHT domain-containing protein n=1 Tax=Xanthomonas tesorieronis TaxID=3160839 RepID=UPI003518CAEE
MTEIGGPTTQAGIRFQDRVAALYLGRMLDPRERPSRDRPMEVRVETSDAVDDLVVRFDDGSRHFFQAKLALQRRGKAWESLWRALYRQFTVDLSRDDRLVLVMGDSTALTSDLKELVARTDSVAPVQWLERLTTQQREIASSIARVLAAPGAEVFRLFCHLDVHVWPAKELARDYAPLWMPPGSEPAAQLLDILAGMVWAGAETRHRFDGATLRDRLRKEWGITFVDSAMWGLARYCAAIAALAVIEVPGTDFRQEPTSEFLWPRCLRYDRDRRSDFDDDLPGWRELSAREEVDLRDFPTTNFGAAVLVAGPGFGKSTVVNAIARQATLAGLVPAVISATKLSDADCSIGDYLERVINPAFDVRIDWKAAAATGTLVLFLDGLDEISGDRRTVVLERFKVYRAAHPSVRWLMTVRDAGALAPPEGALMMELAPLRDADVSSYVAFYRPGEPGVDDALLARVAARADLAQLARIPIFLSLMLVLRLEGADLRRSDLLETYIETLFRPAEFKSVERESIDIATLRYVAEMAAFEALEGDAIGITNQIFGRSVLRVTPSTSVDIVREALIRRGVLRRTGLVRLSFPFPIVQEYLASAELLKQSATEIVKRLALISKRPWAQAIQFVLERHPNPEPLVAQLLVDADDAFHTGLRLLGRCLANGMRIPSHQREEIGDRLAAIWGTASWRSNKLINGIIIDAFSKPLHVAIRARLGERRLIHEGSGAIVALNRDSDLTLSVLRDLLRGDLEHLLNVGDLQDELDRLGTPVFELYLARCRREILVEHDVEAISCLIGHMNGDCVDQEVAHAAANDLELPILVRLAAWGKSGRKLDAALEQLIVNAMQAEGFHPNSVAAQALSSLSMTLSEVARLLNSEAIDAAQAANIIDYVFSDWRQARRPERIRELLDVAELCGPPRDVALLYVIEDGDVAAIDQLIARMGQLSAEVACTTVMLLGHAQERQIVDRTVSAISARTWSAEDRVALTGAFATGLTYRMKMIGLRSGTLEPIAFHPGRSVPHELLRTWLALNDYSALDRLRMMLDGVRLGMPKACVGLRAALGAALAVGAGEYTNGSFIAARTIEVLHAHGEGLGVDELEQMARNSSYNLATSAVALIAAHGTLADANTLAEMYPDVGADLRLAILSHLEPLASRLSLRFMKNGAYLLVSPV